MRTRLISIREAFQEFRASDDYWDYPPSVRTSFQTISLWMSDRDASFGMAEVNASFAKILRDRGARERGWRFGNTVLFLLQTLVARAVKSGALSKNRVKHVTKLPPFRSSSDYRRRPIVPVRHKMSGPSEAVKQGSIER